jgi:hypothetical protein
LPPGAGQVVAHDDDAALRDALVPRLLDASQARDEGEFGRRFVATSCRPATTAAAVRSLYADVARASA